MKLALVGDTMLGRGVAERLAAAPHESLFDAQVAETVAEADLCLANLECCIAETGSPASGKRFHFRAPPSAVDALVDLGVDCVTLANNHALDFGTDALLETLMHLDAAGITCVGAGPNLAAARAPVVLATGEFRLGVVALTDHARADAAGTTRAGVAHANLDFGVPGWIVEAIEQLDTSAVLVAPHWGWNMRTEPRPHVRAAAAALLARGATLIAGHSAHLVHGVGARTLYDLGDFLDDYRVDPELRNDLGLLCLVDLATDRLEAIPLKLEFAHTRIARGEGRRMDPASLHRCLRQIGNRRHRTRRPARLPLALTIPDSRCTARSSRFPQRAKQLVRPPFQRPATSTEYSQPHRVQSVQQAPAPTFEPSRTRPPRSVHCAAGAGALVSPP